MGASQGAKDAGRSRTQGGGWGNSRYIRLSARASARNQSLSQAL